MWLGNYTEDHTTVVCMFTTHASTGAPVAPLSSFEESDVKIYKNGNAAGKTTTNGMTMASPFNSITGLHCLSIDTSNDVGDVGFWVAGAVYTLVLSPDTETVDSVSVTKVIGQFGIELAGALRPTTAGRKLDVSTGGEAGLDWGNIGSPATTVNLSATSIKTSTDVETRATDIQSRLPAALVGGRMSSEAVIGASGITSTSFAADAITASAIAADAIGAAELASDAVAEIQAGLSMLDAAGVRAAVGLASANLDTQLDGLPTAIENADALLDRNMATGTDSGSTTVRTPRQALRFLRNKWSISASTLTVTKEDDTTQSWNSALTQTAGANPITASDPAGP